MARKNKSEKIVLENIELKPQVIGYTYKKKSNIGRVIFIFIIFLIAVYYINDISVFVNNLIGRDTASSIGGLAGNKNNEENKELEEKNEITYYFFANNLVINEKEMVLNNFKNINNTLTFDILNNSSKKIDYSNNKYYIELYTENKTLLERYKLDINTINENSKISYSFAIKNDFYYLVVEEKSIDDYPILNLPNDEQGRGIITCNKDIESIIYTFNNNELIDIKHTISDNLINDPNYYNRYTAYQNKATTYNNIDGISSTFNGTLNGYTVIISIDLAKTNLNNIKEKYYYGYKEKPKVVKFEMQTYGFRCI